MPIRELCLAIFWKAYPIERWKKIFWEDRDPGVAAFVAENMQSEIIGIAVCGPEASREPDYRGEIYLLYVLPGYQNQGVGRALFSACVQSLKQQLNVETMLIWVLAENPYRRFYESLGGKTLSEVGYGREEISKLQL